MVIYNIFGIRIKKKSNCQDKLRILISVQRGLMAPIYCFKFKFIAKNYSFSHFPYIPKY